MKVCVVGPIATQDVLPLLGPVLVSNLPVGYVAAPLVAILIAELLAKGCEVHAITVDYRMPAGAPPVRIVHGLLTYVVLPGRLRAWRPNGTLPGRALDLFRQERALVSRAVRATGADVVHAHWTYEFALGAMDSGLPLLVTAHDSPTAVLRLTRSPYRAARWLMAQKVGRCAQAISSVSPYMAEVWTRFGRAVPRQVDVVPNPVAPYVLAHGRVRPRPRSRQVAMVCNGWSRFKNPEQALRGFARFLETEPSAQLHAYGADFQADGIAQRWAGAQGLAQGVVFHGPLPHAQLVTRLTQHDVLLHPSLEESFGVAVAEALALGLPVIAGRHSGAVPWVTGADASGRSPCAVLVDVRSAADIAGALHQAYDNQYADRSAAARLRAATHFAPAAVAEAYLGLYRLAMHTHARHTVKKG